MAREIYLGVDGGGTKTAFLLDVDGKRFESKQITIHPKQVTKQQFFEIMKLGVGDVCRKAGIDPEEILYTFVAAPGYGQYPDTEAYIDEGIREAIGSDRFTVANDCVNGWAGSLNAKPGINLVLGTGQIGYGVDEEGKSMRSGGWGPLLGDEASGYYIGLKLLNHFTKMSDGRSDKTILYDIIREKLDLKDDMEIIDKAEKMKRDEIASLSRIFTEALDKEDPYCKELLDEISKEAAAVIDSIIKGLNFKEEVKVSYSGGVFNLGDRLIKKIEEKSKNKIKIEKPYTDPSEGALILAKAYSK
ncbi:BadF/BadG/BcrA/BcrD ATPase family protein [uncultured Anaerococcus sp.]|uniref:N-acetylglucosamine kinase n=1 Tax=uncultured Anaerococcus sp. TaxID=293428 RepID=UPI00280483A0|nr:BadF/BadG/BcrA/BcrD ATPase family protein [uncultured Anaerococcus sp.]